MKVKRGRRYTGDSMTAESALVSMLMGVGGGGGEPIKCAPTLPRNIYYYNYQTSVQDYGYDGNSYIYGDSRVVPKDSLVFYYYKSYIDDAGKSCYWGKYLIYQLIIENIDTPSEEVIGIKDMQTGIEYMFQFNVRGGA